MTARIRPPQIIRGIKEVLEGLNVDPDEEL